MKHLGKQSKQPTSPNIKILDKVKNNNVGSNYVIRLTQPEFTCLCPITGQPDFAHIVIDYIPNKWIVESKSLNYSLIAIEIQNLFMKIPPWKLLNL